MHIHLESNWSFQYANLDVPHLLLWDWAGLAGTSFLALCSTIVCTVEWCRITTHESKQADRKSASHYWNQGEGEIKDQIKKYIYIYIFINLHKEKVKSRYYVVLLPALSQGFGRIVGSCVINQLHQTGEKHIKLISFQHRKTSSGVIGSELAESNPGTPICCQERFGQNWSSWKRHSQKAITPTWKRGQATQLCRKPQEVGCRTMAPGALDWRVQNLKYFGH